MRLSLRSFTAPLLSAALVAGMAVPAMAQDSAAAEAPVMSTAAEDGSSLPPLSQLPRIEGLDALDPVVDTVTETILTLQSRLNEILGEIPVLNTLALGGEDAVDASIAFSQATFDAADSALLARDDLFADALATGATQGLLDAPLLLTGSDALDPRVAAELVRLGVETIGVVGAGDAINPEVVTQLEDSGLRVIRAGGPTRIETAVQVARGAFPDATTAVLARAYSTDGDDSQAYADLLAVSPYAAENGWPVLQTQTDVLTASVHEYFETAGITEVIIIGGENAVSAAAEQAVNDLGIATRRVAGENRFATAVAIAEERGFSHAGDVDRLILAEGGSTRDDVWAPGFSSAAHGAQHAAPVLLTDGTTIPTETMTFITDGIADNLLDGGPAAMCASFVDPVACEAAGLLLLGDLTDALTMLNLELVDITDVTDILESLDVAGMLPDEVADLLGADALPTELPELPVAEDAVGEVVEDTVEEVTDTVTDVTEGVEDNLTDAIGTGL